MGLRIGSKIRALRLASELTQAELADRAQLTKGFISQLENDQTSIQIDSLSDLCGALGLTLSEFFSDLQQPKIVFDRDDRVPVQGKGVSSFEILIPGSTNNLMDPAVLKLAPGDATDELGPYSGEQFGFVLAGTVSVRVSNKTYRVKRHQCFYFTSDRRHQIRNTGQKNATLLWITSPPQM